MTISLDRQLARAALGLPNAAKIATRNVAYIRENMVGEHAVWIQLVNNDYAKVEGCVIPDVYMFFLTPLGVNAVLEYGEKVWEGIWK